MHDELTCAACGNFPGNTYWLHYAVVLFLLTWGFRLQRRERPTPRLVLRLCMLGGACVTFIVFASQFLPLAYLNEPALLGTVKAAALTTVAVYLELALGLRREPIPRAVARERASSAPPAGRS